MIIAHLPAGYLLTTAMRRRWPEVPMWLGLVGSVFPDLDMLYFYFVDHRRTLHHHYWTHLPLVWLSLCCVAWLVLRAGGWRRWEPMLLVFAANGLLHHVLDTHAGKILWLAPFSREAFYLFTVPAVYGHWLLNFLLHWTAGFELAIWAAAFVVWRRESVRALQLRTS